VPLVTLATIMPEAAFRQATIITALSAYVSVLHTFLIYQHPCQMARCSISAAPQSRPSGQNRFTTLFTMSKNPTDGTRESNPIHANLRAK